MPAGLACGALQTLQFIVIAASAEVYNMMKITSEVEVLTMSFTAHNVEFASEHLCVFVVCWTFGN